MPLYDWVHLSHIVEWPKQIGQNGMDLDDEDNKVSSLQFLKDHPLHDSHHVRLLDDVQGWIPNLIGGAI